MNATPSSEPNSATGADIVLEKNRVDEGGFGLAIVDALSDRWRVSGSGPARVWFEIGLP